MKGPHRIEAPGTARQGKARAADKGPLAGMATA